MSLPARAERAPDSPGDPRHTPWTAADAEAALLERPDLAERIAEGDPTALVEYLELAPGVEVESIRPL